MIDDSSVGQAPQVTVDSASLAPQTPPSITQMAATPQVTVQVNPPTAVAAVVAPATSLQQKIQAWLRDVYNSNKVLFYCVIPVVGLLVLAIKYHDLIIDVLLGTSKGILKQEQQKDAALAQQAGQEQAAGDALVQQAQQAPSQEKPVNQDWYKQ